MADVYRAPPSPEYATWHQSRIALLSRLDDNYIIRIRTRTPGRDDQVLYANSLKEAELVKAKLRSRLAPGCPDRANPTDYLISKFCSRNSSSSSALQSRHTICTNYPAILQVLLTLKGYEDSDYPLTTSLISRVWEHPDEDRLGRDGSFDHRWVVGKVVLNDHSACLLDAHRFCRRDHAIAECLRVR